MLRFPARAGSIVNFFQDEISSTASLVGTATLDFPSIAPAASADLTIAIPGAELGDVVSLGLPASIAAGLVFTEFVSAANIVTARATNVTAVAIDMAPALFRAQVCKA